MKPYRGSGDDFEAFWSKFLVLANLQQWSSSTDKMNNLPLFLENEAYLVWDELSSTDKADPDAVKATLKSAFSTTPAASFQKFRARTLRTDESVEGYAADLKKLLVGAGQKVASDGKDRVVIEQFVAGLPWEFQRQLRINCSMESVSDCIEYVRRLRSAEGTSRPKEPVGAAAASSQRSRNVLCFRCNQAGHISRNCPANRSSGSSRSHGNGGGRPALTCFFCDETGHVKPNCPEYKKWRQSRQQSDTSWRAKESEVQAAAPERTPDPCLCVPDANACSLPRLHVDIAVGEQSARPKAVVDTGASRNLVSRQLVEALNVDVRPSELAISAIDGNSVPIQGEVSLQVSRLDDAVYLPCTTSRFLVVPDLHAVGSDLVIGLELISALGGVDVQYDHGVLTGVTFGTKPQTVDPVAAPPERSTHDHPYGHVTVTRDDEGNVTLATDDGQVCWDAARKRWELTWKWQSGSEPQSPVGCGIGEYSRSKLTDEQETLFQQEVRTWIDNGWLQPYDVDQHGQPKCVLPFLAQVQEHKSSTPVRPCLDYRRLNACIISHPGSEAPACGEKLRKWRQAGPASEYVLLDIRKAYLQVHVAPSLLPYQVVLVDGQRYVMERMAFGLSIAPKFLDIIVKWVLRDVVDADNYVDDIHVPRDRAAEVSSQLAAFGFETKPAEPLPDARVLGLQLHSSATGEVLWTRRQGVDLSVPPTTTKRELFSWCGRALSHYPVCCWLRPACSFLKRLVSGQSAWDKPVSPEVQRFLQELSDRCVREDPAHGTWHSSSTGSGFVVHCDASDVAIGVVLECDGSVLEDRSWLRPKDDRRHINLAELNAALKGLELAIDWNVSSVVLKTDSKTVFGWLQAVLRNTERVRVSGLQHVLVQRRLQIFTDLIEASGISVTVEWVPSSENHADVLTRVPQPWVAHAKKLCSSADVAASAPSSTLSHPLEFDVLKSGQATDDAIQSVIRDLSRDVFVSDPSFCKFRKQLCVIDGLLCRTWRDPVDGEVLVPVAPQSTVPALITAAHANTGHGNWETMWRSLCQSCFFPGMSSLCQAYVRNCQACQAASPRSGPPAPAVQNDVPVKPWDIVQIDTLELGVNQTGQYHCVLVVVDMFSRWVEVVPLRRHDGRSVAEEFLRLCLKFGPPRVVRCDNGHEFRNAIVSSLLDVFGVCVRTGAVRHPQSQGGAERFNRTILTLIRKVLDTAADWLAELEILLFFYRTRPHSELKISPMRAMFGWEPRALFVDGIPSTLSSSLWVDGVCDKAARVHDYLTAVVAEHAPAPVVESPSCPYVVGDRVLLRNPDRRQKRQPPFDSGWSVKHVIGPASVVICRVHPESGRRQEKVVNVELLKRDVGLVVPDVPCAPLVPPPDVGDVRVDGPRDDGDDDGWVCLDISPPSDHLVGGHSLRPRGSLQPPARYR